MILWENVKLKEFNFERKFNIEKFLMLYNQQI